MCVRVFVNLYVPLFLILMYVRACSLICMFLMYVRICLLICMFAAPQVLHRLQEDEHRAANVKVPAAPLCFAHRLVRRASIYQGCCLDMPESRM